MTFTATLSRYLAFLYLKNTALLLLGLCGIVYLFDTVELIRRANKFDDVPLGLVMQMGFLKLPEVGQILFPFAIFFSAMFTFWQLNRTQQLVVIRTSGCSIWQFLAPIITVALLIGIVQITILNPLGALSISAFERLESYHLKRQDSTITFLEGGLWLRQGIENDGYAIMNAQDIVQGTQTFLNVRGWFFDEADVFLYRIDADEAILESGQWRFNDLVLSRTHQDKAVLETYRLETSLTFADIQDSFASPATLSFWRLPSHIHMLEKTGFDTSALRVHYHTLLSQPLLFAAMILLAACVSLQPPRSQGNMLLIGTGLMIGFLIFFISSFLQALGASQQMPPAMASWTPALVSTLLGVTVLLNQEDG